MSQRTDGNAERERLVKHICEWIRMQRPTVPVDRYFKLRTRLQKTSLAVLREIVESDMGGLRLCAVLEAERMQGACN